MQIFHIVGSGRYVVSVAWLVSRWLRSQLPAVTVVIAPTHTDECQRVVGDDVVLRWPKLVITDSVDATHVDALLSHASSHEDIRILAGDGAPEETVINQLLPRLAASSAVVTVGYDNAESFRVVVENEVIAFDDVVIPIHREPGVDACLHARVGIPHRSHLARTVHQLMELIDV